MMKIGIDKKDTTSWVKTRRWNFLLRYSHQKYNSKCNIIPGNTNDNNALSWIPGISLYNTNHLQQTICTEGTNPLLWDTFEWVLLFFHNFQPGRWVCNISSQWVLLRSISLSSIVDNWHSSQHNLKQEKTLINEVPSLWGLIPVT